MAQPWFHWGLQLSLLAALGIWVATDASFPFMTPNHGGYSALLLSLRGIVLLTIILLTLASMVCLIAGLFFGSRRFRNLRSLMAIVTLAGLWLALGIAQKEIAWQGKRYRLAWQLEQFDSIAQSLHQSWPMEDGEHSELGPFMAYPFGTPRTLVLLAPPRLDSRGTTVSVIERRSSGSLLFQLAGNEQGGAAQCDWLEWHPGGRPESFVGGLNDAHQIDRWVELHGGWHLVRYES